MQHPSSGGAIPLPLIPVSTIHSLLFVFRRLRWFCFRPWADLVGWAPSCVFSRGWAGAKVPKAPVAAAMASGWTGTSTSSVPPATLLGLGTPWAKGRCAQAGCQSPGFCVQCERFERLHRHKLAGFMAPGTSPEGLFAATPEPGPIVQRCQSQGPGSLRATSPPEAPSFSEPWASAPSHLP